MLMTYTAVLPKVINQTYINQASFWLTFFPYVFFSSLGMNSNDGDDTSLRGFLAIFDLAQFLKLMWISFQTRYVVVGLPVVCFRWFAHKVLP